MALASALVRWDVAELVWDTICPPKHRFLMWLDVHITKEQLAHMNIYVEDMSCGFGDTQYVKTTQHLFNDCIWFRSTRDEILQWFGIVLPSG